MAPKTASVTINYKKPGTQPPIYVAGSFSVPAWQPHEMQFTINEHNEYEFHKELQVEEGKEYQYKFRIGAGDWWIMNEDAPTVTDDVGNSNNLLTVPVSENNVAEAKTTNGVSNKADAENAVTVPKVIIEKTSSEPRHGDDFGRKATVGQKNAYALRAQDPKPDLVSIRAETNTPELANVAAEVADSAAILDREQPTPPVSDEEAGRIGLRRLSHTPIPEVANTAAEVAESAAKLDMDDIPIIQVCPVRPIFGAETPGSGTITPPEEKVPLFAHECLEPPTGETEPLHEPFESSEPPEEFVVDASDPLLEEFPSERESILERVRTVESRMSEDQTSIDDVAPSPDIEAKHHSEQLEPPLPSPGFLAPELSPSLDSIAEEHGFGEDHELSDSQEENVETPESEPSESSMPKIDGPAVVEQNGQETSIVDGGPNIVVQPASPAPSIKGQAIEPAKQALDTARTTAVAEGIGSSELTNRRQQPSPSVERPLTPSSMRSAGKDAKTKNFLKAFWRVVFVDWIGGLIIRLCGGRSPTLLAIMAVLLVTVAPAIYLSL